MTVPHPEDWLDMIEQAREDAVRERIRSHRDDWLIARERVNVAAERAAAAIARLNQALAPRPGEADDEARNLLADLDPSPLLDLFPDE